MLAADALQGFAPPQLAMLVVALRPARFEQRLGALFVRPLAH